jgi:hypothetical protein
MVSIAGPHRVTRFFVEHEMQVLIKWLNFIDNIQEDVHHKVFVQKQRAITGNLDEGIF